MGETKDHLNDKGRGSMRFRSRMVLGAGLCAWMLVVLIARLTLAGTPLSTCDRIVLTGSAPAERIDAIRDVVRDGVHVNTRIFDGRVVCIAAAARGNPPEVTSAAGRAALVERLIGVAFRDAETPLSRSRGHCLRDRLQGMEATRNGHAS